MGRRFLVILLSILLIVPAATPSRAQKNTPEVTALAAVVFPGVKSAPSIFGVYLGHGLVLTNWHPWTEDGRSFADGNSPLSPSQQARGYDDDGVSDPGEAVLNSANCAGAWVSVADRSGLRALYPHGGRGVYLPAGRRYDGLRSRSDRAPDLCQP